jgi:biotin carboxylase
MSIDSHGLNLPYIVFIESNTSGTGLLFAQTARRLGFCPVLMCRDDSRYPWLRRERVEFCEAATGDISRLSSSIAALRSKRAIAGIFSSSEYFVEIAARLARLEGLPGAEPEAIACCRDKRRQRKLLREAGLLVPWFSAATSQPEVSAALRERPCPLILKPAFGTGSIGVRLCRTPEEVMVHAEDLFARGLNERGAPVDPSILIEEYLEGPEYSVEILGQQVIGVTRKLLSAEPLFVETGHDFPAHLSEQTIASFGRVAMRGLSAVGLTWGPAHVELRLTRNGPVIIEINPRLAGGFIPELVRHATGIDLIEETLCAVVDRHPRLQATRRQYASIRFFMTPGSGIVASFDGAEDARRVSGVCDAQMYRQPGDEISPRGDFRDRIGHVIATSQTLGMAAEAAEQGRLNLRVKLLRTEQLSS